MLAGEEEDRRQVRRWVDPASERRSKRRRRSIQANAVIEEDSERVCTMPA